MHYPPPGLQISHSSQGACQNDINFCVNCESLLSRSPDSYPLRKTVAKTVAKTFAKKVAKTVAKTVAYTVLGRDASTYLPSDSSELHKYR